MAFETCPKCNYENKLREFIVKWELTEKFPTLKCPKCDNKKQKGFKWAKGSWGGAIV